MKTNKILTIFTISSTFLVFLLTVFIIQLLFSDVLGADVARQLRVRYIEPILKKVDVSYLFFDLWNSKLPKYKIIISTKDYNELMALRKQKLKDLNFRFPYKKAKFIYDNKEYDVRVKLRGLLPNHWMDNKKSWRVKFPKDNLFKGIRRLNLIVPADRDYLKEHLAYYTARKFGLATPRSGFASLQINNKDEGVYFEVEQMGQEYLAKNYKPEDANLYDGEDNYMANNIFEDISFWKKITAGRGTHSDDYSDLYNLLKTIHQPDTLFLKNIDTLVDIDKMLKWNATSMLYFDYHQNNAHNVRLLFSPIIGKFEPLIWDCSHPNYNTAIDRLYNDLVTRILKNPKFLHRRNLILWDYLKGDINLKDDLAYFDKIYRMTKFAFLGDANKNISNLRFLYVFKNIRKDISIYYSTIKDKLKDCFVHGTVHYNVEKSDVLVRLELLSGGFSAARLDQINTNLSYGNPDCSLYYDDNEDGVFDERDLFIANSSTRTSKSSTIKDIDFTLLSDRKVQEGALKPLIKKYTFFLLKKLDEPFKLKEVSIETVNAVTGEKVVPILKNVDDKNFKFLECLVFETDEFRKRFPIFSATDDKNRVVLKRGEYIIDQTIVVPKNTEITIEPGAILKFSRGISFISYGKITAKGEKTSPIIFKSSDKPWGVFAVVGNGADGSIFENTVFTDASEDFINGVHFTGGLAIHGARTIVSNCVFENNHGNDALNIKQTDAKVEDSIFRNNDFDGVDLDFVRAGFIKHCRFENNSNDGIDTNFSEVIVRDNVIDNSGDKGISCGESSTLVIFNNSISNCDIGVAIKDKSDVIVINNNILYNKSGISLYNKKPVWEKGGSADIYNTVLENNRDILSSGDSKVKIGYSVISDNKYANKENSVFSGTFENIGSYSGDKNIVSKYFPDIKREKIPIGVF